MNISFLVISIYNVEKDVYLCMCVCMYAPAIILLNFIKRRLQRADSSHFI